jgi:23S rRNA (guanine745-N1)-methyltransferase
LVCSRQHSFDLAREGYVNLFPAHHRQSLRPGDDARMVNARRRFLDAGHYAPLLPALSAAVTHLSGSAIRHVVDLGCGEGYFTNALNAVAAHVYGVDVSRTAIRAAAKRYPQLSLAVASSRRLPLVDAAFDAATAILAPLDPDVVRVLADDGMLVRVSPGPDHLRALRSLAYGEARSHRRAVTQITGLEHVSECPLRFTLDADRGVRADLICMTPLLYRTDDAQRARAMAPDHLTIEADFRIDVFRKAVPTA